MARPYGLPGKAKMARTRIHRRCCHNPLALGKIELRTATADEERTRHRGLLGRDKVAVDSKDLRSFLREAQHRRATVTDPLAGALL